MLQKAQTKRMVLPLTIDDINAIDRALAKGETRLDFIRCAIKRELERHRPRASPLHMDPHEGLPNYGRGE